MASDSCALCGCQIHRKGEYAKPNIKGRSHATRHHYVAKRFFARKGKIGEPIFKNCPWGVEGQGEEFCYECHEELLHNPVLLRKDIERFNELTRLRGLNESQKSTSKDKIAR